VSAELDREAWAASRRLGLGGTDVAAILGESPWKSPMMVWLEKHGQAVDAPETTRLKRGLQLEQLIADEWAEREAVRVERAPHIRHPEREWACGSPDFIVREGAHLVGVLETKTAEVWHAKKFGRDGTEAGDGTIPAHYAIQLQWYLWLTGAQMGWFAVMVGLSEPVRSLPMPRDDAFIATLVEVAGAWWQRHIIGGEMPEPDGTESSTRAVKAMHPLATNDEPVALPADAAALVETYQTASAAAKEHEKRADEAKQRLCLLLGNHSRGIVGGKRVTWSNVAGREGFDVEALRAAYPHVFEQFRREGKPYRRFSIANHKGGPQS